MCRMPYFAIYFNPLQPSDTSVMKRLLPYLWYDLFHDLSPKKEQTLAQPLTAKQEYHQRFALYWLSLFAISVGLSSAEGK